MTPAPSRPATDRANTFPWPPVLLVALVAAGWVLERLIALPWPGTDDTPARIIGIGFGVIGVVLIAWAIVELRRAGTTVMPDQASSALVTRGPFARFRNPIYLGEVLLLLTTAELTKNLWFVAAAGAFAGLVTVLQIGPEERHLEARFGDAYRAYKAKSRRWI
ncbi:MAG: isoprenylcysteine carboxylmethyltransferase family protein [Hyphomicrobium sp.]|nr:isoprenylcysteine carboxylmethyltransferase family protein [Hyphomicrobium sp.]